MRYHAHFDPQAVQAFADEAQRAHWLESLKPWQVELGKVQRASLPDGGGIYLKRAVESPGLRGWQALLRGHWPRSAARREWQLLQRLRAAGFRTMEPLAWGEQRRLGTPAASFLVVREVHGQEVAELFQRSTGLQRLALMREVGELVGRLHAAGFFHPVRLKDLIRSREGLVLIDRETSKPWPSRFGRGACLRSLARSARRTVRDGYVLHGGSAMAFVRGYCTGIAGRWPVQPGALIGPLIAALRQEWRGRK